MKNPIRVKICGITIPAQAKEISDLGVDALGCILAGESPRKVTVEIAREVFAQVPAFVSKVLVMVNVPKKEVPGLMEKTGANVIQLHGEESPEYCAGMIYPLIKALRIKEAADLKHIGYYLPYVNNVMLDAFDAKHRGGTGLSLEPEMFNNLEFDAQRLILSGGLGPDNISAAIENFRPMAVDINSGVESGPGIKDLGKIEAVMNVIRDENKKTA